MASAVSGAILTSLAAQSALSEFLIVSHVFGMAALFEGALINPVRVRLAIYFRIA